MSASLFPFTQDQTAEIVKWRLDNKEAKAWAGQYTPLPVAPDQFRVWHQPPDVYPFTAQKNGNLVAYGEIYRWGEKRINGSVSWTPRLSRTLKSSVNERLYRPGHQFVSPQKS